MRTTAALESLRTFAVDHGEIAFAHLVTAALNGEQWAIDRAHAVIRVMHSDVEGATLEAICSTDTTRPDGATPRGGIAPI